MTIKSVLQLAYNAGFRGTALVTIVAIAIAESGLNPNAVGPVGELGLTQIYLRAHPNVSRSCALDPQCNMNAAYNISNHGTNFHPWTTFNNGAYKASMSKVAAEAKSLFGINMTGSPPPKSGTPGVGTSSTPGTKQAVPPSTPASPTQCAPWDVPCMFTELVHSEYFQRGSIIFVGAVLALIGLFVLVIGHGAEVSK